MPPIDEKLYIDGEFEEPDSEEWILSRNPYTGEQWARVPRGKATDINRAVEAAHEAAFHGKWAHLTPTERGGYLRELANALEDRAKKHAEIEVKDNGKPIREMQAQHEAIPEWFRYYAGLADKIHGETIPTSKDDKQVFTLKEPIGVVAAITPWNSPLMLATWKIAPALAAGNAIVLKPDEKTSTSALAFAQVLNQVDFPKGAVNVVTGYGNEAGHALTTHKRVDKISFTGGTETGSHIASNAGKHLKRTTMELGGKSPNIVFPDANLNDAVKGAISGIFSAAGQSCSAGSRLLLHSDIHDGFVEEMIERAEAIRLGDPTQPETEMGPLASQEQFERVSNYVDIGLDEGASLITGGGAPNDTLESELFFSPTIFTDVENDSRLAQEEIFGPVLAVIEFDTEREAIDIANDVKYGLAAGIWTEDMRRAHRVASSIRAGRIWINNYRNSDFTAPQGGFKQSGWGRENGVEAIEEYLQTKSIWLDLSQSQDNGFKLL